TFDANPSSDLRSPIWGAGANGAFYSAAWYVRSVSGTRAFRLAFIQRDDSVDPGAEELATEEWQRFYLEKTITGGAGGTNPRLAILQSGVSPGAGALVVALAHVDAYSFPTAP